jgi:hypothetical protein
MRELFRPLSLPCAASRLATKKVCNEAARAYPEEAQPIALVKLYPAMSGPRIEHVLQEFHCTIVRQIRWHLTFLKL